MKARTNSLTFEAVIDHACPWNLPRLPWEIPKYPATMAVSEWKSLLAKASRGDAEAELRVAETYSDGCRDRRGKAVVLVSPRKAVEWYRRSAQRGSPVAQGALGYLLSEGIGAKKDPSEAIRWMKRAFLNLGSSSDANNIAITYRQTGNFRQAVRWFRIAVAAGDDGDLVQLGIHFYWGKGVRIDRVKAVAYFRKAIQKIDNTWFEREDAFFYLGVACLEGRGARKSLVIARKCFERANKENDHPAAQRLLKKMAETPCAGR
jgi:uncharacterized protein